MKLESLCEYVDGYLRVADFPDYPNAYNGLQVQGRREVGLISAAVDASEAAINAAVERGSDLLLVHHGLFWDGRAPVTGRRFRKLAALLRNGVALYSAHLPLDAHPEVGNCGLLARALGIKIACGFGTYQGADVGWIGTTSETRESLRNRLADTLQVAVRLVDGGPEEVRRVAVVTGAGGSMIAEAARAGADAFITGRVLTIPILTRWSTGSTCTTRATTPRKHSAFEPSRPISRSASAYRGCSSIFRRDSSDPTPAGGGQQP